jgi:hypothetical protein
MNFREKFALSTSSMLLALLASATAFASGVSVLDASKSELNDAKGPYLDGVKAMNSKHYKEAAEKFQQSYDIVASPNSRLMLGRALIKVNRPLDAYRELEQTVAQATELAAKQPKYQKTADAARKELDDVKVELAFITVVPGTEVSIGGKRLSNADWGKPQPVIPGRVTVEITANDGRVRKKRIRLEAGVTRELTADLSAYYTEHSSAKEESKEQEQKPSEESSSGSTSSGSGLSQRTVGYISGAVGIAGVGAFIGLNLAAQATFGDPKSHCNPTTRCSPNAVDNAQTKGLYQGAGIVALTVGVAGLGLGAYLIFTDHSSSDSSSSTKASESSNSTSLQVGPGSFLLQRTF